MSSATIERVQGLAENRLAVVVSDVFDKLFDDLPYAEVQTAAASTPELAALTSLTTDQRRVQVPGAEVADVSRALLVELAGVDTLAPYVEDACDRAEQSDKLFIGAAVTLGALVNLTYVVMATDVKVSRDADGNTTWSVKKKASAPEFIKDVLTMLAKVVPTSG